MPRVIAIQPDNYGANDASSPIWASLLEENNYNVRWVDVYQPDIIKQLKGCAGFMWRHGHVQQMHQIAQRLMRVAENELKLTVYPSQNTAWHYDDKISQTYLFQALNIPHPKTWVWFKASDAHRWAKQTSYPKVMKLYAGASSTNVILIHNEDEANYWITRHFKQGVSSFEKTHTSKTKLLLNAIEAYRNNTAFQHLHYGYIFFQEFIPKNDFDTRITIIGNRAFGFRRFNRENDFRASGSGKIDYAPENIDPKFIRLAFKTAHLLDSHSCAIDGIWKDGKAIAIEVSYTYASYAVHACPGHWELDGNPDTGCLHWIEGQVRPEEAQIEDYLVRLLSARKKIG